MDEDQTPDQTTQEEVKDRTGEQFEKLTASNKNLKSEVEQLKQENEQYKKLYQNPTNQAPSANQYSNLSQQQVNDVFAGMVDPNGFLDGNKLREVLNSMNQKALLAEQRAQQAEKNNQELNKRFNDREEKQAQDRVYSKYPQLNPDNKDQFDPKMWRAVYNELAVKAKAGDIPSDKDYMDAADRVYSDFYEGNDMNKKDQAKKEEIQTKKEQINATKPVSNLQKGYYANSEEDQLLEQVRQGKRGALAEMLNRRGQ